MAVLISDTETSGFPVFIDKKTRTLAPTVQQPHITQLAGVLYDDLGAEIAMMSALIEPEGWVIEPGAEAATGITTDYCREYGVPLKTAMALWGRLARKADLLVFHNAAFDMVMLEVEGTRLGWGPIRVPTYCTMEKMTPIVRIPHKNARHDKDWKWPTLTEAHVHLFGTGFDGAHDALVDVRACAKIYWQLRLMEREKVLENNPLQAG